MGAQERRREEAAIIERHRKRREARAQASAAARAGETWWAVGPNGTIIPIVGETTSGGPGTVSETGSAAHTKLGKAGQP